MNHKKYITFFLFPFCFLSRRSNILLAVLCVGGYLFPFSFLQAQDTLEVIVTWEQPEDVEFRCTNPNSSGSDLNNDGYDDFIHFSYNNATGERKFQFYFGSSNPGTEPDLEISTDLPVNFDPSWGGDLNGDGYKDIVFSVSTDWGDPGDIYICLGGEEIDLEPELILHGEDYAPDPYNLGFKGINGGYDFNGDGYDDLLAGGTGPDMFYNGQVDIFFGGEEIDNIVDFHIQGACQERFGYKKAAGDINGDGYDDLIASRKIDPLNIDDIKFEIYMGGPDMDTIMDYEIEETYIIDDGKLISNNDFNNDGYEDLIISSVLEGYTYPTISIYLGNQTGNLEINSIVDSIYAIDNCMFYCNINNDDFYDVAILMYRENSYQIEIYYGNSEIDFSLDTNIFLINQNYRGCCNAGDFNMDEEDEILIRSSYNSATMYGLPGGNSVDKFELQITNVKLMNYPNPFKPAGSGRSPGTTISYDLPVNVENPVIEIFNIKGERICELKIENVKCKINTVVWNGKDYYQNPVSSGVYLYRLKTDDGVLISKRMLLLR
ncbi:MAG: FG-GAP repeat protein [Candidatus Cloacimonetes bacterium]|nr:FG-GAP repeat protein [Candidatus Cloacimonadota bacterium]